MTMGILKLCVVCILSLLIAATAFAPGNHCNVRQGIRSQSVSSTFRTSHQEKTLLFSFRPTNDESISTVEPHTLGKDWVTLGCIGTIGFLYWYWMVFGAAAASNGLPGIPDFLPMTPGWPPSQEDLQGPLDDAYHFFYLSEFLGKTDAPFAPPTRLAVYNVAEAWIFAMLPLLWKDSKRLPRPVLLGLWAILGINLTNAFLAPYLFVTEAFVPTTTEFREKNRLVSFTMGSIASAVALYAISQVLFATSIGDWNQFLNECKMDRTYFAFVVDLGLFSLFQPYLLRRVAGRNKSLDYVPFVGLMSWLFEVER
uniref:EXPERA domain-containing protein n=1 Tax=Cyclophora tenuis TaxID=216820 RepID=A0A7S1D6D4_CYCTE